MMVMTAKEAADIGAIENFLQEFPAKALGLGWRVILAILAFVIGVQLIKVVRRILKKSLERSGADIGVMQFLDSFVKAALYIILVLMIAGSFGMDAASIMAILGSAGVAISLAIQGSLSNFAGGVLILLLKPFKVGDYIIEDSNKNEGTVSEIQLFYTKLTTPDDKVIILPNGALANTSLTNVTATQIRRMDLKIGISYEADLSSAKQVLQDIMEQDKAVLKEKECFTYVDELGESAVVIGMRCWFTNEDYWNGKWRITENAKLGLDAAKIGIPYPQMDVHLNRTL